MKIGGCQVRHERGLGFKLLQKLSDSHNFPSFSVICCYSKVGSGMGVWFSVEYWPSVGEALDLVPRIEGG